MRKKKWSGCRLSRRCPRAPSSLGFDGGDHVGNEAASNRDVSAHRLLCFDLASSFNIRGDFPRSSEANEQAHRNRSRRSVQARQFVNQALLKCPLFCSTTIRIAGRALPSARDACTGRLLPSQAQHVPLRGPYRSGHCRGAGRGGTRLFRRCSALILGATHSGCAVSRCRGNSFLCVVHQRRLTSKYLLLRPAAGLPMR